MSKTTQYKVNMKIRKKLLAIPAFCTVMAMPAHSALVLEFNEVASGGGTIVRLSFSGSVDLSSSTGGLDTNWTIVTTSQLTNSGLTPGFTADGGTQYAVEISTGVDALTGNFVSGFGIDGDKYIGLEIDGNRVNVLENTFAGTAATAGRNVNILNAGVGGDLNGVTIDFNSTFAGLGLNNHTANQAHDLWLASAGVGDAGKIQFRVNTPVPEPSTTLLSGIAGLTLLLRRKKRN